MNEAKRRAPIAADAIATIALCGYSLAVAIGFARVFSDWTFLGDLAAITVVGHGLSFLLRRARVQGWVAVPLVSLVLVWLMSVQHYRDTMSSPIPWSATWARVRFDLGLVRDEFPTAVAPVLYDVVGWAALASIAIALVVVLSDSFAFRAEARGEALVPGGVLFVFISALGSDRLRIASTVLLIAAGVIAVIALRRLHDSDRGARLSSRDRAVSMALPAALASALCIALVAGFIGPRLPGAHAEPLYDTTGRGGTNFLDSPLVDIRSRLTNRGNVELFRVNADVPRYWRSITLAEFTGEQFRLPESPISDIDESASAGSGPGELTIRQQVQIISLGGQLVPAAADAQQASGTTAEGEHFGLRRQSEADTLLAPDELRPDDRIDVVSVAPTPTADELRAAGVGNAPDPIYLDLPDDLPDVMYEATAELTEGLPTPYDQAMALQSWFRDPNEFSYSTDVQSGHGSNAIESFFRVRVGYCEQFSATFAAMARIAGIPSRVAVGYTYGNQLESGWYSVIGKNAHAWPELWFDGIGWVAFEPTPGRGAPGAQDYTGLQAQQDDSGQVVGGDIPADDDLRPTPTVPPTVVPNDAASATTLPNDVPNQLEFPEFDDGLGGGSTGRGADDDGSSFPWIPVVLSVLVVVALVGPWAARRVARLRRRNQPPREQVTSAWARARSAARDAGVAGTPAMTATEWTAATATVLPVAARPMRSLAHVVDQVMYAAPDAVDLAHHGSYGEQLSDDCELWANQVDRIAIDSLSFPERVKRYFTHLE